MASLSGAITAPRGRTGVAVSPRMAVGQVLEIDLAAGREQDRVLDRVHQLADVAREGMLRQRVPRAPGDAVGRAIAGSRNAG